MNKEDYVSLEVAKMLKEKGYNEPCETEINIYLGTWAYCDYDHVGTRNSNLSTNKASYPTLYEAAKWLREKHKIHLDVRCTSYCKPLNRCDYVCEVFALLGHIFSDTNVYHKYEEALNAGILEALKLI